MISALRIFVVNFAKKGISQCEIKCLKTTLSFPGEERLILFLIVI